MLGQHQTLPEEDYDVQGVRGLCYGIESPGAKLFQLKGTLKVNKNYLYKGKTV